MPVDANGRQRRHFAIDHWGPRPKIESRSERCEGWPLERCLFDKVGTKPRGSIASAAPRSDGRLRLP